MELPSRRATATCAILTLGFSDGAPFPRDPGRNKEPIDMHPARSRSRAWYRIRRGLAVVCCVVLFLPAESVLLAQAPAPQSPPAPQNPPAPAAKDEPSTAKLSADQLDSLVAPIALYPDPLLAQTLVASTYPLELIQLQQWLAKHPELKDKALADAVAKQPWDPSIQTMAAVPEVVKRLADDVQWTTELGNAFLAQQSEVMDSVQRMRKTAKDKGALESNKQQTVETKVVEEKTVIVVESADPEVIYVPTYSPTVVYGPPVYPYPPIYYPTYPPGAAFVSFSFGVMMGAAIWGGSCCGCGWGGNDVNINVNNNFNRNTNINRGGAGGGGNWSHNPEHRGAAHYADKATSNKYGGSGRGESAQNRQAGTKQSPGTSNRAGGAGASDRSKGGAGAGPSAGTSDRSKGGAGAGASTGNRTTGGAGGSAAGPSASNRAGGGSTSRPSGGDSIGSRNIPKSGGSGGGSAFGGSSGGYSGNKARSSSSRGASSMGSRGGGGGRGGGGRGGGRRR